MSEQCRYFDATGGCDLVFSQTAKHEQLAFTNNRITQPGWVNRNLARSVFRFIRELIFSY